MLYIPKDKQVDRIIKPKELLGLFLLYHSLNPSQAIERILEGKGFAKVDLTTKGDEILCNMIKLKHKL